MTGDLDEGERLAENPSMNEGKGQADNTKETEIRLLTPEQAALEDRTYWHSKTPAERLAAAERLRQLAYGYDPITARIQATAELVQAKVDGIAVNIIGLEDLKTNKRAAARNKDLT